MSSMNQHYMKRMAARSDITSLGLIVFAALLAIALTVPAVSAQDTGETQAFVPVRSTYGVSVGTPAVINFNTDQYFSETMGLRFAGGYSPGVHGGHAAGLQAGLIWKVAEKPRSCTTMGAALGYSVIDNVNKGNNLIGSFDYEWTYVAATFGYRYRNLFLETGLSVGDGTESSPQFLIQCGLNFMTIRRAP